MKNTELEQLINDKLNSAAISDYAPNGLQVEGKETVQKIVTGVTASQALLDEAVRLQADAVIVHHGYFWKGESPVIRGMKRRRLKTLLANDINLYGWHLPLDAIERLQRWWEESEALEPDSRSVEIPVIYGGAGGPDLAAVARHSGLSEKQVVELHASVEYVVWFLGFQPGFPYLGNLPEPLHMPRRAEPRLQVPAGSVGIGGAQTGIYPLSTPGGWQLIGLTPLKLFDPMREPPVLLRPGDSVRFVPQKEGIC
ncbi:5-oxoprolinase subunit PxpB [Salmonella enterica]|uniref:5-oxoprolinase subunit PxpB n=7 Tax=Salmonella enterica TaxID=28901 RepID=UPI0030066E5E